MATGPTSSVRRTEDARSTAAVVQYFQRLRYYSFLYLFFSPPGTRKPCLSLLWAVEKKRAAGNESGLEGSDSGGSRFSSLLLPCNHVILSNLSLPLTAEAKWYLVPPLVTLVSDGAGQSGDWKRQVRHGKVCQLQGKAFQSQLPPVGRGCPQRMKEERPTKGNLRALRFPELNHTAVSRKPPLKL